MTHSTKEAQRTIHSQPVTVIKRPGRIWQIDEVNDLTTFHRIRGYRSAEPSDSIVLCGHIQIERLIKIFGRNHGCVVRHTHTNDTTLPFQIAA